MAAKVTIMKEETLTTTPGRGGAARTPSPTAPPPIEVVLSFDTTGSMYKYLDGVRSALTEIVATVSEMAKKHRETVNLGVLAHGDYCDKDTYYITKYIPLTNLRAADKLSAFIRDVKQTGGGDEPECYELALHTIRKKMGWTRGSRRIMVMIGDADPHEVGYTASNGEKCTVDWREELEHYKRMHIHTFAVEAGDSRGAGRAFWRQLAEATGGSHVRMSDIATLPRLVTAAVLHVMSPEAVREYTERLRSRGHLTRETEQALTAVRTVTITVSCESGADVDMDAVMAAAMRRAGLGAGGSGARPALTDKAASSGGASGSSSGCSSARERSPASTSTSTSTSSPAAPMCSFYLKGHCRESAATCKRAHPAQCRHYLAATGCRLGDKCKFAHIEPCRFFAEAGGCKKGAECSFAHIARK